MDRKETVAWETWRKREKPRNHCWHLPTGLEVKCQKDRLRETNRVIARRLLCDAYEEKILHKQTKKDKLLEKIKKQKKRRQRRAKPKTPDEN